MDENYEKRGYLLEDFRLFHLKDDRGTKVDYHYHEFCKIVLLLSGSGSYTVEGRRYLLLPGDIVLVGSRCVHKPEFEEGISYERMILYISPSLLAENSVPDYSLEDVFSGKPGHVLRPAEDVRRRLRSLAGQLESEMAASGGENAILSRCTLLRLLVEIGRAMQKPAPSSRSRSYLGTARSWTFCAIWKPILPKTSPLTIWPRSFLSANTI